MVLYVSDYKETFKPESFPHFERLASASSVEVVDKYDHDDAVSVVTDSATVYIPLADMIDFEKELARLAGEKEKTVGEIERIEKKLSNESFVSKAPEKVVNGEKEKLAKYREKLDGIEAAIAKLK